MAAISPRQLDTIAAFLETSRDYLDIEHTIRLHWPPVTAQGRCRDTAASSRATQPARKTKQRPGKGDGRRFGV